MINKNIKRMLLFITLCFLLIGIVSATDNVSDDTSGSTQTITEKSAAEVETVAEVEDNVIDDNKEDFKKDSKTDQIKTATSAKQTKITIDPIPKVSVDDSVFISGTFTDINNNPLRYTHLKVVVNGEAYYSQTNDYGDYFGEYYAETPGTKTVTVSWAGNTGYAPTTAKTTFTVDGQYPTYINLNNIKDVNLGDSVSISGYYRYDQAKPLRQTAMTININGAKYYARTNDNGYFNYNYKTTKTGTNTVTVSYPGNTRFKSATETQTFNVKSAGPMDTYITLNNINDVKNGEYVTISGYYRYDQAKPLRQTAMTININGAKYYARTNDNGYFTYSYKATKAGTNTVTVSYPGNTRFKSASVTKTFNVKSTGPQDTYILLNNINDVNNGQYVTISGYYYYGDSKPLRQTAMTININGAKYYARTNDNGYFTYSYKTTKDGSNSVTVSYPGNNNFKATNSTKTFNVKSIGPKTTYIKLNNIYDFSYDDYTYITGYYYYGNDIPLIYTPMTININDKKYTTKTDSDGFFSLYYSPEKVGKNTVNVSYPGNNNFKGASATKTFNVIITSPIETTIDMFIMGEYELGKYMDIHGYYYYGDGIPLTQTTMTIDVEGQIYHAKTDNNGYFSYKYKPTKSGPNIVTVTFDGNKNFRRASCVNTIIVLDLTPKVVTLKSYSTNYIADSTIVGSDNFYSYYETKTNAQSSQGVWVENRNVDAQVLDDLAPTKRILSAKFYFRNSNNQIKTKTVNAQYIDFVKTSLISGYTPFKVDVTYRDMTEQDTAEWYGQFEY